MIDATAITDPHDLIARVLRWLDARRGAEFAARAASVPGMNGLRQLCDVYGVPVRWSL